MPEKSFMSVSLEAIICRGIYYADIRSNADVSNALIALGTTPSPPPPPPPPSHPAFGSWNNWVTVGSSWKKGEIMECWN